MAQAGSHETGHATMLRQELRIAKNGSEQKSRGKSANMGPEGHTTALLWHGAAQELQDKPVTQHEEGGNVYEEHEDEGSDPRVGIQEDIRSHHTTDRPGGTDHRNRRGGVRRDLRRHRSQAAEQVEEDEAQPAHRILYIDPEDPEEPHVADEVEPTAVHEHRGECGIPGKPGSYNATHSLAHRDLKADGKPMKKLPGDQP